VWSRDKKRKPRDGYQSVGTNRPPTQRSPPFHKDMLDISSGTIGDQRSREATIDLLPSRHSVLTASEVDSSAGHAHGGDYDGHESEPENSVMS
jgi:hypothetical protein